MPSISMKVFPVCGQLPAKPEVTCQPYANRMDSPWAADVYGIAGAGLQLASKRRFEAGAVLLVRVLEPAVDESTQLLARVMKVGETDEGRWVMYCRLTSELHEIDLKVLRRAMRAVVPTAAAV
jgi:hypothetical protein